MISPLILGIESYRHHFAVFLKEHPMDFRLCKPGHPTPGPRGVMAPGAQRFQEWASWWPGDTRAQQEGEGASVGPGEIPDGLWCEGGVPPLQAWRPGARGARVRGYSCLLKLICNPPSVLTSEVIRGRAQHRDQLSHLDGDHSPPGGPL